MKENIFKKIRVSVAVALIICVMLSLVGFDSKCDDLRNNVLRLHILANSDSTADQNLKLAVRDAILATGCVEFESCTNLEEALKCAEESLENFKCVAEDTVKEYGYDYKIEVLLDKTYFNTRVYDDFTLPAGFYNALVVKIGKAEGKNWWCVMFPAICVPAATDAELSDSVESDSADIALNADKYQIRFKAVEIYQYFKKIVLNK